MNATYSIQCPCCGKIETFNQRQAYVTIMLKNGIYPRTYEICSECTEDLLDLMEGRLEARIEHEQEERIPTSLWGHHE